MTPPGLRGAVLRAFGWAPSGDDAGLRRIELDGATIEYRIVRAARRSIGIRIGLPGVTVRAPYRASLRSIEAALREQPAEVQSEFHA